MTERGRNKIMDGLEDAIEGRFDRATFFGIGKQDALGAVVCPRCDSTSTWSAPDTGPEHCWECDLEFRYRAVAADGEEAREK